MLKIFSFVIHFLNTENKIDIYSSIAERENENLNIESASETNKFISTDIQFIKKEMF